MILSAIHGPHRTNDRRYINLLAYHRPDSVTWRWLLSVGRNVRFRVDGEWRPRWLCVHTAETGPGYGSWALCVGSIVLSFHWQPHMACEPT